MCRGGEGGQGGSGSGEAATLVLSAAQHGLHGQPPASVNVTQCVSGSHGEVDKTSVSSPDPETRLRSPYLWIRADKADIACSIEFASEAWSAVFAHPPTHPHNWNR